MALNKYTVEIRDQYGRLVTTLTRAQSKQFNLFRNRAGSAQFMLDLYDPQATLDNLKINQYDVIFRRQGTPVFAGQISYVHPIIDGDRKQVEVIATGYMDMLDYRVVTQDFPGFDVLHNKLNFSNTDVGQIAWSLINYSQFPLVSDGTALCNGVQTLEQSFVSSGTGNLKTLKMLLSQQGVSAGINLTVSLVQDAGGLPKGAVIPNSTQTIAANSIQTTPVWITFDYSTANCQLAQGQTYWIKIALDAVQSGTNGIYWAYLNGDYYQPGQAYSLEQPNTFTAGQDLQFFALLNDNSFQMTKNTYLGINQGFIQSSFLLSPNFDIYKKLKAAIEDMANTLNGIDFSFTIQIDPTTNLMTKFFNVYYPRIGVDNTALDFLYPGNIKKIEKPKDGKTMENEIFVRGQGFGIEQLSITSRDATSILTYSVRQGVEQESDVTDSGTLTSLGNEYIRVRKDPLDLPEIVVDGNKPPSFGTYGVGDTIRVQVNGPSLAQFNQAYRIEQIAATVNDDDQEEIALTVSLA